MSSLALLTFLVLAQDPLDGGVPVGSGVPVALKISGNLVFPPSVYRAVLRLPSDAAVDEATAQEVAGQLQGFLLVSGYVLAEVAARVEGDVIAVDIDEGQLERVVFKGPLTVHRIRLALGLSLPHYVFNEPDFRAQVAKFQETIGVPILWELVPARETNHVGPQLTQIPKLPAIRGLTLVPLKQRMELVITTGEPDWPLGLGLDVRTSFFEGIELGLHYQGVDLFTTGSRFRVAAGAGVGVRGTLIPFNMRPAFSRATAEFKWFAPQIAKTARPYIHLYGEQLSHWRDDVNLAGYQYSAGDLSLNVVLSPASILELAISIGAQVRSVYALEPIVPTEPIPPDEPVSLRPFGSIQASLLFSPRDHRWDTEHRLTARVRYFVGALAPEWGEARLRYRNTLMLGWHELRLKANAVWLWGNIAFHDEDPLPDPHLRGVFLDIWVRRAASAAVEFRFSLIRDVFLVSLFADAAVYGRQDRVAHTETPQFGVSVGPGVHFLFEGTILFDLTFSVGVLSNGQVRFGPMLLVNKVL